MEILNSAIISKILKVYIHDTAYHFVVLYKCVGFQTEDILYYTFLHPF